MSVVNKMREDEICFIKFFCHNNLCLIIWVKLLLFNVFQGSLGSKELVVALETKDQFKIYEENLNFQYEGESALPYSATASAEPVAKSILDPFSHKNKNVFLFATISPFIPLGR